MVPPRQRGWCLTSQWGATPADWSHFSRTLGLESDLLPIVADPSAKPSPLSKIVDPGKVPTRFNQAGEMVGIPAWTQHRATDRDIGRWSKDSRLGICVIARQCKAIDIDIADPVITAEVREFIALGIGNLPMRFRSNSGKCLLAFRLPLDFPKRVIRTAHGIIELLSEKQQFVAVSTHTSGVRYEWVDADGVIGLPAELPELTMAEVDVLWQALTRHYALPDGAYEERNGLIPTKPRTADDMQDPTVAWLDENGWVTGYERDGRVNVRCPWEHEHTTDTGPSATTYFPAGVGGFATGGWRCLHGHCSHRTVGDFLGETGYIASGFEVVEAVADATGKEARPLPVFTRVGNGQIEATIVNLTLALARPDVCGLRLGFDEFKSALMCCNEDEHEWRPFTDADYPRLTTRLERGRQGFKPIEKGRLRDAVTLIGQEQRFDSAIEWISRLQWDGVPRIEQFYVDYFGAEDTPYARAMGLYTWTALAGRAAVPGTKADMVPVLIGPQGVGKTSGVRAISPHLDMFAELSLDVHDDNLARKMRGTLVGELGELRGLSSRDEEAIKQWITRTHEEWTPKYMEYTTRFARRLLLFGTANREEFLADDTGNRRWLPLRVGDVDVVGIEAVRDQLWAEGRTLFEQRGVAWQEAHELAPAEHSAFRVNEGEVWTDAIREWLARDSMDGDIGTPRGLGLFTLRDVLVGALGMDVQRISRRDELRAGRTLRVMGCEKRVARVGGTLAKVWTLTGQAADDLAVSRGLTLHRSIGGTVTCYPIA